MKVTKEINSICLKLFNKVFATNSKSLKDEKSFIENSLTLGYAVHPALLNCPAVREFISNQKRDLNSTFYKSFSDVVNKSRYELFIDQCLHYECSSYVANDFSFEDLSKICDYKYILPMDVAELSQNVLSMLYSGAPLQQETIDSLIKLVQTFAVEIDISLVKNKEAKLILCDKLSLLPKDATEMVRFLVYKATGKSLLIKNKKCFTEIKASKLDINKYVTQFGADKLSSVFYRFKPIFLAFKSVKENKPIVNELRRLCVKNHVPYKKTYFESVLSDVNSIDFDFLKEKVKEITSFKIAALLQTCLIRLRMSVDNYASAYIVRNGKIFIKKNESTYVKGKKTKATKTYSSNELKNLNCFYEVLYNELISRLALKACKVKMNPLIDLTVPTSEKNFIGNYPIGTSLNAGDNDIMVGIHWFGKDGAQDLDLSLYDLNGNKMGWNSYYNKGTDIIYSGDMTSANPEASEIFYAKKGFATHIVGVNLYRGGENSKFKLFVAKEKVTDLKKNHMVERKNIILDVDLCMDGSEKKLGLINDGKFVLLDLTSGSGRVGRTSEYDVLYTSYIKDTCDCFLSLKDVLTSAGFTLVKEDEEADIDLTNLDKSALLKLFG
jgi:hypothetical protein